MPTNMFKLEEWLDDHLQHGGYQAPDYLTILFAVKLTPFKPRDRFYFCPKVGSEFYAFLIDKLDSATVELNCDRISTVELPPRRQKNFVDELYDIAFQLQSNLEGDCRELIG